MAYTIHSVQQMWPKAVNEDIGEALRHIRSLVESAAGTTWASDNRLTGPRVLACAAAMEVFLEYLNDCSEDNAAQEVADDSD